MSFSVFDSPEQNLPASSQRNRVDRAVHAAMTDEFGERVYRMCHVYAMVGAIAANIAFDTEEYGPVAGYHDFLVGTDEDGEQVAYEWSGYSALSAHSWVVRIPDRLRGQRIDPRERGVELIDHTVRFRRQLVEEQMQREYDPPCKCYWGVYRGDRVAGGFYSNEKELTEEYRNHMYEEHKNVWKPVAKDACERM
jgi:hypothetical protein